MTDTLEHYLKAALTTTGGVKRLREIVLTLAMQGRLVQQDPADRPAGELLEAAENEKTRLVRNKTMRASGKLPAIEHDEHPYKLPPNWQWARIGSIGNVFNGNSINAAEKLGSYMGVAGRPYVATKDVGYGFDELNYDNGVYIPESENNFRVAHQDAVLICAEGGSAGKKCGITDRDICFGNKLFANELFGEILPKFILYVYLSPVFRASFEAAKSGIIGGVSLAKFKNLLVPLPPANEQLRIVSRVEDLLNQCDGLDALLEDRMELRREINTSAISRLLDATTGLGRMNSWNFMSQNFKEIYSVPENVTELRAAILELALRGNLSEQLEDDENVRKLMLRIQAERAALNFSKKHESVLAEEAAGFKIPASWTLRPLADLLIYGPTNGFSPRAVPYETPVRSLTLSATTSGTFKGQHSKFVAESVSPASELWLRDGDILVQRGNTLEYVGVPAVYRGSSGRFIYPDLMMKLRVSSELDTDYIYYVMSAGRSRAFLRARASGTSGTMPKINQKALMSLPIPVPPVDEQRRIVARINHLFSLCEQLEQESNRSIEIHAELMNSLVEMVWDICD